VSGYVAALIVLYIQKMLFIVYPSIASLALFDYSQVSIFLYAFIFGVGAITGDLVKSFFKRRLSIKPGAPWFPFDQLDFIVGVIVFMYPLNPISIYVIWTLILITPVLHILTNIAGYNLGLKKVWW
jgi:CDP-2,3-bis-(O-geranylgeranyl)-sn-glycerol synthase